MPKIDADSVREHREHRINALIGAAEDILATDGVDALTAGVVAARAGIARNSIYRYFDSIEDLIEVAVTRKFPAWSAAVSQAVEAETTPHRQALAYVRTNLELAADGTHQQHTVLSRRALSPAGRRRVKDMHSTLEATLRNIVVELNVTQPELVTDVIQGIVDACIRRIDAGDDFDQVLTYAYTVTEKLLT